MEKNSNELKFKLEEIFLANGYKKVENNFEKGKLKFVYADEDSIIGLGYFVRFEDDLVETVYFPDVKFLTNYLSKV
jgi:hypothetical protein